MSGQILLAALTSLFAFIILYNRVSYANFIIIAIIICISYLATTYFADLHANAAEGLLTCFLAETNCESPLNVEVCPDALLHEIDNFQLRYNLKE